MICKICVFKKNHFLHFVKRVLRFLLLQYSRSNYIELCAAVLTIGANWIIHMRAILLRLPASAEKSAVSCYILLREKENADYVKV